MTAPPTDPHWALDHGSAALIAAIREIVAALVNEAVAELSRQQIPVLKAQERLDQIGDLRTETELILIERNHATIRDIERQLRDLETRMAAIELDWIAQKPPEA